MELLKFRYLLEKDVINQRENKTILSLEEIVWSQLDFEEVETYEGLGWNKSNSPILFLDILQVILSKLIVIALIVWIRPFKGYSDLVVVHNSH